MTGLMIHPYSLSTIIYLTFYTMYLRPKENIFYVLILTKILIVKSIYSKNIFVRYSDNTC